MKLADAAKQWLEAKAAQKDAEAKVDEAAKVLKAHFQKTGRPSYAGVGYSRSTYRQLDTAKARALLGDKAADAEVVRTRETLTAL